MAEALWQTHGLVMNGGVLHSVEVQSDVDLDVAIRGFRFFGLSDLAELLERARGAGDHVGGDLEAELDAAYSRSLPDDGVLEFHINRRLPRPATKRPEGRKAAARAFEKYSVDAHELARPGTIRLQHRAHDLTEEAVKELLRHWDEGGHDELLRLLGHPDPIVRSAAAIYLARSDPDRALPVLEELQANVFAAKITLDLVRRDRFPDPLARLLAE